MKRLAFSLTAGTAAGAGVVLEAQHVGVTVTMLVLLIAAAVDAGVTLIVAYIWGEIAAAHRDVDRILRKAQADTDDRRDQQILDAATAGRADW